MIPAVEIATALPSAKVFDDWTMPSDAELDAVPAEIVVPETIVPSDEIAAAAASIDLGVTAPPAVAANNDPSVVLFAGPSKPAEVDDDTPTRLTTRPCPVMTVPAELVAVSPVRANDVAAEIVPLVDDADCPVIPNELLQTGAPVDVVPIDESSVGEALSATAPVAVADDIPASDCAVPDPINPAEVDADELGIVAVTAVVNAPSDIIAESPTSPTAPICDDATDPDAVPTEAPAIATEQSGDAVPRDAAAELPVSAMVIALDEVTPNDPDAEAPRICRAVPGPTTPALDDAALAVSATATDAGLPLKISIDSASAPHRAHALR